MAIVQEFKAFALRGNVIDLAVGVIIGAAFNKIVSALVDNVIMPLIGIILGGKNFNALAVTIGESKITYGMFISAVIDFIIIALVLFFFIRFIAKVMNRESQESKNAPPQPADSKEVILLKEIRDLLKARA